MAHLVGSRLWDLVRRTVSLPRSTVSLRIYLAKDSVAVSLRALLVENMRRGGGQEKMPDCVFVFAGCDLVIGIE